MKKSITDYITESKDHLVLVLGSFSEGSMRLNQIRSSLAARGYHAIRLDDVVDHLDHSLTQKFMAIASVARFLVFDDSEPSGHLVELPQAVQANWVTVVLRRAGHHSSYMTSGIQMTSTVVI